MNKFFSVIISVVVFCCCSQESRDEVVGRFAKAGKALNGDARPNDKENGTPNIVAEQAAEKAELESILSE